MKFRHLFSPFLFVVLIWSGVVFAKSCIVDTNNNAVLDAGDTDSGADASVNADNLRCGKDNQVNTNPARSQTVAIGLDAISSKNGSTIIGAKSTDTGNISSLQASTVLGSHINSPAKNSLVVGSRSTLLSEHINSGENTTVLGYLSGIRPVSTSWDPGEYGRNAVVLGAESYIIGHWSNDEYEGNSVNIGYGSRAGNLSTIAIGQSASSSGSNRVASQQGSISIGQSTTSYNRTINIGKDIYPDLDGNKIGDYFNPMSVSLVSRHGQSRLNVDDSNDYPNANVKRLMRLICSPCTPAFRFASTQIDKTWFFVCCKMAALVWMIPQQQARKPSLPKVEI